jgi:hypothetical protein
MGICGGFFTMHSFGSRSLFIAGFVVFGLASVACGGSKKPAQAPTNEASEAPRVGSTTPDPAKDGTAGNKDATPSPATAASSSADNGSDIIPPFPSSGPAKGGDKADKSADKSADKDTAAASSEKEQAPPKKKAAKSSGGAKKNGGKGKKKG